MACSVLAFGASNADAIQVKAGYTLPGALEEDQAVEEGLKAVDAALRSNPDDVSALIERAKLQQQKETPEGNYQAEVALRRALKIEPAHESAGIALGELLWKQGKWKDAELQFRRVQEYQPKSALAAFMIGYYGLKMFVKYEDMESIEPLMEPGITRTYSWAGFAVAYFEQAIDLDPDFRDPYFELAHLYFEREGPRELVGVIQRLLDRYPEDPDALLLTGLGYQESGDERKAWAYYTTALTFIDPELRALLKSVELIGTPKDLEEIGTTDSLSAGAPRQWDSAARSRFWHRQDPLYLTEFNERRMEHYGRVAYAILAYGRPQHGIPGWKTDMGRAYVKFGKPKARHVQRPEIDPRYIAFLLDDYFPTLDIRRTQASTHHIEYWIYEDYAVAFRNWDGLDGWRLDTTYHPFSFVQNGLEVFEMMPSRYEDPYHYDKYDAPFQLAQFRGEGGASRLELYYALDETEVQHTGDGPGVQTVSLNQGLFLFDARWDTVARRVGRVKQLPYVRSTVHHSTGYLFSGERFELQPGGYHLAAEVKDLGTGSVGTLKHSVQVLDFGGDSLKLSSVLLAQKVVEREGRQGRDRFMILPNPMGRVRRDEQAAFYFEVYNLTRDNYGRTRCQVSYQIQRLNEGDDDTASEWTTAVSYDHEGGSDWEPRYLRLDMADAQPGVQTFRVMVEDRIGGQTAESVIRMRVMW